MEQKQKAPKKGKDNRPVIILPFDKFYPELQGRYAFHVAVKEINGVVYFDNIDDLGKDLQIDPPVDVDGNPLSEVDIAKILSIVGPNEKKAARPKAVGSSAIAYSSDDLNPGVVKRLKKKAETDADVAALMNRLDTLSIDTKPQDDINIKVQKATTPEKFFEARQRKERNRKTFFSEDPNKEKKVEVLDTVDEEKEKGEVKDTGEEETMSKKMYTEKVEGKKTDSKKIDGEKKEGKNDGGENKKDKKDDGEKKKGKKVEGEKKEEKNYTEGKKVEGKDKDGIKRKVRNSGSKYAETDEEETEYQLALQVSALEYRFKEPNSDGLDYPMSTTHQAERNWDWAVDSFARYPNSFDKED